MKKLSVSDIDNYKTLCDSGIFRPNVADCKAILDHIDAIEDEKDQLIDNVAQLQLVVNQYRASVNDLELQLDAKKVALPREVAVALDVLNIYKLSNYNIISWARDHTKLFRDYPADVINALSVVDRYDVECDIVKALVNGYTVEEEPTTEEKIEARLAQELERTGIDIPIPLSHLANQLTLAVREVLAEDRQHD